MRQFKLNGTNLTATLEDGENLYALKYKGVSFVGCVQKEFFELMTGWTEITKKKVYDSEDGFEILENDTYYWVCEKETAGGTYPFTIKRVENALITNGDEDFDKKYKVHIFKYKEKAQLFIDECKPKYSYLTVKRLLSIFENRISEYVMEEFLKALKNE